MRQLQKKVVLGIVAAFVGLAGAGIALGFFTLALFFWLLTMMSAASAASLTALIVLVAAGSIIVIVRLIARARSAPQPASAGGNAGDIAAELGKLLGGEARGFANKNPVATVIGSLALGFMVGVSPGLRDLLRRGL